MTARELFREIQYLDRQIDRKITRLGELQNGASCIGGCDYSAERVQTSSSGEPPYVRRIEKIFELDTEIDADIDRLVDLKAEARRRIRCLPEREQKLLELRYFRRLSWKAVAEKIGCKLRNVYYLHGKALDQMDTQDVVSEYNEITRYG